MSVPPRLRVCDWSPLEGNPSLVGFAVIATPSDLVLPIFRGSDGYSAGMPSRPQLDRNGNILRKANGKVDYAACVGFATRHVRDRWSRQVIEALRADFPDVFGDGSDGS